MLYIVGFIAAFFFSCGVVDEDAVFIEDSFEFTRYYSNISTFRPGSRIQYFPSLGILAPDVPSLSFRFEWLDPKPVKQAINWFTPSYRQPSRRSFNLVSTQLQIQMRDNICNGNYRIWVIASVDSLKDSVDFDFKIEGGQTCETVQPLDSADFIWPSPRDGEDAYIQLPSRKLVLSSERVSQSAVLSDFQMTYSERLNAYFLTHPNMLYEGWEALLHPQNGANEAISDETFDFFPVPPYLPLTTNIELYHISESIKSGRSVTSSKYVQLNPGETWLYRDKSTVLGIKVLQTGNRLVLRIFSY